MFSEEKIRLVIKEGGRVLKSTLGGCSFQVFKIISRNYCLVNSHITL